MEEHLTGIKQSFQELRNISRMTRSELTQISAKLPGISQSINTVASTSQESSNTLGKLEQEISRFRMEP